MPIAAWATPVEVYFNTPTTSLNIGNTFTVDLMADITDPVGGFGLDVSFDTSILSLIGLPAIGSSWLPAIAPDGDGLAGFAPFTLFGPQLSGSGITLATLTFQAVDFGTTTLAASMTPNDFTEGFPLPFPALPGSFAAVNFTNSSLTVDSAPVPEPATMLLFGTGLAGFVGSRIKRKKKA